MRHRRWVWVGVAVIVLLLANMAAEWEIARRLESRYRGSLADDEGLLGDFERISVCLPCLSYTLHELRLENRDAPRDQPILYARKVDVGGDYASLLRGRWRGSILLHDAQLRVEVGDPGGGDGTAFSVPWSDLGRGLFPAPIERIEAVEQSRLVLRHTGFAEPLEWAFLVGEGRAVRLAPGDGRPNVYLKGSTPGRGQFELELEVGSPEGEPSQLNGELRDVALEYLGGYLQQRLGVEVERGQLSAQIDLEETKWGWQGTVDCEVVDLQTFALSDVIEEGPLQAARDGLAGIVSSARRSSDGVLRLQMEVNRPSDSSGWRAAGDIAQWLVLAPFNLPLQLIQAASS